VNNISRLVLAVAILLAPTASHAAFVAYDGFSNYGNTPVGYALPPTGNAIIFDPGSPGGNDNIGQNPATAGFTGPWKSDSAFASSVYAKAENSQLTYKDDAGWMLRTSPGQMNFSRDTGSSSAGFKYWSRDLNLDTSLPDVLYASMLVEATPGIPFWWRSASTDGGEYRRFGFDVSAGGNLSVIGVQEVGGTVSTTVGSLAADEPHLIVMRFENNVNPSVGSSTSEGDQMKIWVDPLLGSEGNPDAILSTAANRMHWYVADNPSWTLGYFEFRADPAGGEGVILDEFRIGETWESVTAYVVPEPTNLLIWSLLAGLGVGLGWRRRK